VRLAWLCIAVACATPPRGGVAIADVVAQIRRADYEGDRAALERLYGEFPHSGDARVRYWRGFAMWRKALNAFNDSSAMDEIESALNRCIAEFEAAGALVDAKVGAASCLQNLAFVHRKDARGWELLKRSFPLLREAEAAEPDNPRLLWVLGASRWYTPPDRGGGQEKAIETYERGLRAAQKARPGDRLDPSWGEPELLMNLAFANLNKKSPDIAAAERYAREALRLVPHWHYVRDILLPQIQRAAAKGN